MDSDGRITSTAWKLGESKLPTGSAGTRVSKLNSATSSSEPDAGYWKPFKGKYIDQEEQSRAS